jgi:ribonuclease HI
MLALDFIEVSQHDKFAIFSDSVSCSKAIGNAKFEDPMIKSVLEKCHFLQSTQKTIVFWWVPSHVGIRGNEKADAAAKGALDLATSNVKIPHTDLKYIVHTHYSKKWQSDWDHVAFNKL